MYVTRVYHTCATHVTCIARVQHTRGIHVIRVPHKRSLHVLRRQCTYSTHVACVQRVMGSQVIAGERLQPEYTVFIYPSYCEPATWPLPALAVRSDVVADIPYLCFGAHL